MKQEVQPNYTSALFDVAVECALRRKKYHDCKHEFDSEHCFGCKWYLRPYTGDNSLRVNLFMLQAEGEVDQQILQRRNKRLFFLFLIVLCSLITYGFYASHRDSSSSQIDVLPPDSKLDELIWETLRQVTPDMKQKIDFNKDGKVNCIDASISFYKHFPYKSICEIRWNKKMMHLCNAVRQSDGLTIPVEPQAHWKGWDEYHIGYIHRDYDQKYNEDVTWEYEQFAK